MTQSFKWSSVRDLFFSPGNLAGLAACILGAVLTDQGVPLLAWLGVEVIYLGVSLGMPVRGPPGSQPHPSGWESLSPSQREQYRVLRSLRGRVDANLGSLPGGKALGAVSQPRLDALLEDFVRLLNTLNQYREFLGSAEPETTAQERAQLRAELAAGEGEAALRDVKQRRLDILEQRLARIEQVRQSREVVAHELAAIEDLVRLAYEQSVAVRDPEHASETLIALSEQAKAAEETVQELERFQRLSERGE